MKEVVSVSNMRVSDKNTIENKIPSKELMYRAGKGVFESVQWHGKILIVCGTGNNAGDGYVVASLLKEQGLNVELLLLEERFSADGKYYFDMAVSKKVPWSVYNFQKNESLCGYDIIIDCIFGTGFKGKVEGTSKEVIEKINKSGAFVVSVDINSGLNGDSGLASTCVKSDLTVSIGTAKSGHYLNQARDEIGKLINIDIGIDLAEKPFYLLEREDVKGFLGKRKSYSHKGTYGYIALIGGCTEYSGAVKLANLSASAMRSGAGVVRLAVPKGIVNFVSPYLLESTVYPLPDSDGAVKFDKKATQGAINGVKCVAFGMGLSQKGENERLLEYLLKNCTVPLIIDADGINTLAKMDKELLKNKSCTVVLTPHLKEFERLTGISIEKIQADPVKYAKEYARDMGVILLLKGNTTVITDGESVYLTDTGCPGMATAGSGDVLSGIVAALCASHGDDALMAVSSAAYINGYAGELAQKEWGDISMVASDTAKCVAKAIKEITN